MTEQDTTPCRCAWTGAPNHDALLEWFRLDSPERSAELIYEGTRGHEDHRKNVPPLDYPDFIAEHNWPDPVATRLAAVVLSEAWQRRTAGAQS